MTLSNSESEKRKEAIAKEIQQLNTVMSSSNYRSKDGCGFTQKEIDDMKAKVAKLLKEYKALPNIQINVGMMFVNKIVTDRTRTSKTAYLSSSRQESRSF
jgi:hypothetical protein